MEILFWVFVALFVVCLIGWIVSLVRGSDAMYIWNIGICSRGGTGAFYGIRFLQVPVKDYRQYPGLRFGDIGMSFLQ